MKDLEQKRSDLLKQFEIHHNFLRGSITSVCAACNRANCICQRKSSRQKAYRLVHGYDGNGPPHPISADAIETLFAADFEVSQRIIPQKSYPSRPIGSEELCLMRKRAV